MTFLLFVKTKTSIISIINKFEIQENKNYSQNESTNRIRSSFHVKEFESIGL